MAYDATHQRDVPLSDAALSQLFTEARTRTGRTDRPVAPELLRKLYDLTKFGPTAVNGSPARFVFITSPEAKARLIPLMSEGNRAKTQQAPVNLILAQDLDFHDHLPTLFPHAPGARDWFADEAGRRETAFRNSSLQGGYFLLAARALGLDVLVIDDGNVEPAKSGVAAFHAPDRGVERIECPRGDDGRDRRAAARFERQPRGDGGVAVAWYLQLGIA